MKKILILLLAAASFITVGCDSSNMHDNKLTEENTMELFDCAAVRLDKEMSGADVTSLYLKETEQGKAEGYTPVILGLDRRVREMVKTNVSEFDTPEEFRKNVLSDTEAGRKLLENGFEQLKADFDYDMYIFAEDDERLNARVSTIPKIRKRLWSVKDSEDSLIDGEGVYLVRVPTANPWEVTAWLPFCGWNECPAIGDMLKICRFWYEEYGAAPAFISGDIMMFWVDNPISDIPTAREISHQHAVFCSEFLGMTGLDSQTADIMTSNIWNFWWD